MDKIWLLYEHDNGPGYDDHFVTGIFNDKALADAALADALSESYVDEPYLTDMLISNKRTPFSIA